MYSESPLTERRRGLVAVLLACGLAGCVTAKVEEFRAAPPGAEMAAHEKVVILARRHHRNHQAEAPFMNCVSDVLADAKRPIAVHSNREFMDGLFPWFEPRVAPLTADQLPKLLANPMISDRIEASGVRYLVWIDGNTERIDQGGAITCAAGPGGAGCLGFGWWEKDSSYEASIWDLKQATMVGKISAEATGTSYLPALVVPIPIIAPTRSAACRGLAGQLGDFLGTPPAAAAAVPVTIDD